MLATVLVLKKFRDYLFSTIPFTDITSHQTFRYTFRKKIVHGRLALQLDFMAEYEFRIEYRPGKISAQRTIVLDWIWEAFRSQYMTKVIQPPRLPLHEIFQDWSLIYSTSAPTQMGYQLIIWIVRPAARRAKTLNDLQFGTKACSAGLLKVSLIPVKYVKGLTLEFCHVNIGHLDERSTLTLISDRF